MVSLAFATHDVSRIRWRVTIQFWLNGKYCGRCSRILWGSLLLKRIWHCWRNFRTTSGKNERFSFLLQGVWFEKTTSKNWCMVRRHGNKRFLQRNDGWFQHSCSRLTLSLGWLLFQIRRILRKIQTCGPRPLYVDINRSVPQILPRTYPFKRGSCLEHNLKSLETKQNQSPRIRGIRSRNKSCSHTHADWVSSMFRFRQ